ncbi:hypothetical protein QR680_000762 [Steinernema hermaphroditum]|uniref:Uncharacterized protein n=1 Tax=Steinernema hermaphroditum TaxID=289476 RepID=A0AA39GVS5_9BILA|nr:hypothetical protein QR680_000762 [Steinernema hermaphroditum]
MSADILPCSSLSASQHPELASEMNEPTTTKSCSSVSKSRSSTSQSSSQQQQQRYESSAAAFKHTVALAVITRLQQWCRQLFWLTIICVMGCCGELNSKDRAKTIQHMRRTISQGAKRSVAEIEMQLLRHLTSPQTAVLRTSRGIKKRGPSRPPSPQLFDISEENEIVESEC